MGLGYTGQTYWFGQFCLVLVGYLSLMFLWPTVVFGRHLRGKGMVYRFGFCVSVQPVLLSTVVLFLGLLHLLDRQIIWLFLAVPFLLALFDSWQRQRSELKGLEWQERPSPGERIWAALCRLRCHRWELLALGLLLLYALVYFSWGHFQYHNYSCGDNYVHHAWIYELKEGKPFAGGIYPAAMHCFIYVVHIIFDAPVYSIQLFLGSIHTVAILLSACLLLRELFGWRYTPLFSLALFLFLDIRSNEIAFGVSRLAWTLPQEFGMAPMFVCPLFLLRYLRGGGGEGDRSDKPLFLFMVSLAATVATHFYATMIAFFLCLAFSLRHLRRLFSREKFLPLAKAVLCGVLIAAAPMLAGRSLGIPFQDSIDWAVQVMQGEGTAAGQQSQMPAGAGQAVDIALTMAKRCVSGLQKGYTKLYGTDRGHYLMVQTGLCFALGLLLLFRSRLPAGLREWVERKHLRQLCCDGWLPLAGASLLLVLVFAARSIGLPELIDSARLASSIHLLMAGVVMIPLDMVFVLAEGRCPERTLRSVSFACLGAICAVIVGTGNYHIFLYGIMTRYNADVEVTNSIINAFPSKSYTIVAPTDVLYQVIDEGWHQELSFFMQEIEKGSYVHPSQNVFIYVEKKPLRYAQQIRYTGPAWLGRIGDRTSICAAQVSWEAAQQEMTYNNAYRELEKRTILESKVYYLCRQLASSYPQVMQVYYEDDDFVCYWLRQDSGEIYDLGEAYDIMLRVALETEDFTESARFLSNPDRGFYRIYRYRLTDTSPDDMTEVTEDHADMEEHSLALVEIDLHQYSGGEITPEGLANLRSLFDALRAGGKRLILRFLYDWEGKNLQREPRRLEIVLTHMEQVGQVVRENSDIIFTLQGLFVGDWGEMHNTRYTSPEELRRLAQKLAAETGDSWLAVRTPAQWRQLTGLDQPGELSGLSARLGLFNDAILSGATDLGTYPEGRREAELAFQQQLCGLTPNGGEVITDNPRNDLDNAIRDLSRMHVTYLNRDYDRAVLEKWAAATVSEPGCFDGMDGLSYIERHLGYRLVLDGLRFRRDLFGGGVTVEAAFRNVGFAPLYREPAVLLRLVEEGSGRTLEFPLSQGLRELTGGPGKKEQAVLRAEISLDRLPKGEYSAWLTVTDPASGSAILLANEQDPEEAGYRVGTIERR